MSDRDEIWIFGYGSLLWHPGFAFDAREPAIVQGWHRRFSLRSTLTWGSIDAPGIAAALYKGGTCFGAAFRLSAGEEEAGLAYLDQREFGYLRQTVELSLPAGGGLDALTYVRNPDNPDFLMDPPEEEIVKMIRTGVGFKGSSRAYLERTVEALDAMRSGPTDAHTLLDRVKAGDTV
ncbi:MAG: gamma-glutamylcyclotransferase [Pseudomonadota bacterium]